MAGPILITGAGSGFGKEVALRLAAAGHEVIAGVEIIAQVTAVRAAARERGVELRVEKVDVTDPGDRERAWTWNAEVLLNNAGVSEGGASADIPEERLRRQFEVNVFGPILLTQGVARAMAARRTRARASRVAEMPPPQWTTTGPSGADGKPAVQEASSAVARTVPSAARTGWAGRPTLPGMRPRRVYRVGSVPSNCPVPRAQTRVPAARPSLSARTSRRSAQSVARSRSPARAASNSPEGRPG